MKSPKQRFLEIKPAVSEHLGVTSKDSFAIACDFAMLDLINKLPLANDMGTAAANYWRIYGAKEYLEGLVQLSDQPKERKISQDSGNLDHKV